MTNFKNKNVAILGLGLEGKDALSYLINKGAKVSVFDQKEVGELNLGKTSKSEINFFCGKNYDLSRLRAYDVIVRSPGVYRYLDDIVRAEKKGVEITSPIKIFLENCIGKIIGVTGTKGKGTTATLIYRILQKSGFDVHLVGNIGTPYLILLPKLKEKSWVIMELSSFQLIDIDKSPHIAVVLNITEDHLDWHKDRRQYIEAKKNIVRYQNKGDFAVINNDYVTSRAFSKNTKSKVYYFSTKRKVNGCYVHNVDVNLEVNKKEIKIGDINKLLLKGRHNWENVCAAVCASYLVGADVFSIKNTIFSFKGLEHRLELVGRVKGVTFYNDSFATSPQPTIAAIEAFDERTTLILGGYDKGLDYRGLAKIIAKRKNIKAVILIGDLSEKIKNELNIVSFPGEIIELGKSSMREIVKKTYQITPKGGIVLFSPAAASFDMFENYKARGKQFKDAVKRLKNKSYG